MHDGYCSTHTQQKALILLDGTQASQKTRHHDDTAEGDDEVGGRERREGGRQGGETSLWHRQPQTDTKQSAATQLKHKQETQATSCPFNDNLSPDLEYFLTVCVCRIYPEEQVEEKEHIFYAADATTSHGSIDKRCKKHYSSFKNQKWMSGEVVGLPTASLFPVTWHYRHHVLLKESWWNRKTTRRKITYLLRRRCRRMEKLWWSYLWQSWAQTFKNTLHCLHQLSLSEWCHSLWIFLFSV